MEGFPQQSEGAPGNLESITGSNMAPFLTKLFQIVSAATTDRCIMWTTKGDSFVISDPDTFARDILPTYFKHNNIRSFIRQLNTYGFRKRTNISSSDEHLEFFHEKFRRDQPSMLMQIKRCHQPKPAGRAPAAEDAAPADRGSGAPSDIDSIRNRVGDLKNRLGSLQTEIRDYNQQMDHKVNLLLQVLQSSGTNLPGLPLLQQAQQQGQGQAGPYQGVPPLVAAQPVGNQPASVTLMGGRCGGSADSLLGSLGDSAGLGQISNLGGLSAGNFGAMGGGGLVGTLSTLGALGKVAQSGDGLQGIPGGALAGSGLIGNLSNLGALADQQKVPGTDGGLQHLLEAAQRYQSEDSGGVKPPVEGAEGAAPPAKRLCSDTFQQRSAEPAHA